MTDTVVPGPDPAWGPYRDSVADHIDSCADYVGRIQRSLAGAGGSRHYAHEKAHQLRAAAGRLVDSILDVEGWLVECGADFTVRYSGPDGVETYTARCVLIAGHTGAHAEEVAAWASTAPIGERTRTLGREARQDLVDVVDRLEWLALRADGKDRNAAGLDGDDRDELARLGRQLAGVSSTINELREAVVRMAVPEVV